MGLEWEKSSYVEVLETRLQCFWWWAKGSGVNWWVWEWGKYCKTHNILTCKHLSNQKYCQKLDSKGFQMVVKSLKSHRRGRSYNDSAFETSWESSFLSWKTLEGGPRLRIITDLLTQIGTMIHFRIFSMDMPDFCTLTRRCSAIWHRMKDWRLGMWSL